MTLSLTKGNHLRCCNMFFLSFRKTCVPLAWHNLSSN